MPKWGGKGGEDPTRARGSAGVEVKARRHGHGWMGHKKRHNGHDPRIRYAGCREAGTENEIGLLP